MWRLRYRGGRGVAGRRVRTVGAAIVRRRGPLGGAGDGDALQVTTLGDTVDMHPKPDTRLAFHQGPRPGALGRTRPGGAGLEARLAARGLALEPAFVGHMPFRVV